MAISELVTRAGNQQTETYPWGSITWVDSADLTGTAALTIGRVTIEADKHNPAHRHPNCDESLFLLEGTLEHWIGEESTVLNPGDCLHIPEGEPHRAVARGETDTVAVIAYDTGDRQFEPVE